MAWWHKQADHQQPWYWPNARGIPVSTPEMVVVFMLRQTPKVKLIRYLLPGMHVATISSQINFVDKILPNLVLEEMSVNEMNTYLCQVDGRKVSLPLDLHEGRLKLVSGGEISRGRHMYHLTRVMTGKWGVDSQSVPLSHVVGVLPWQQSSWGQHGAHLGPTGSRWAPCWPHEPYYLG